MGTLHVTVSRAADESLSGTAAAKIPTGVLTSFFRDALRICRALRTCLSSELLPACERVNYLGALMRRVLSYEQQ